MLPDERTLRLQIRRWLVFFITALLLSGLTAFAVGTELEILTRHSQFLPPVCRGWLESVYKALRATNNAYPYLAYGTDWLAFAHVVIATVFIGPLRDPVRNVWVVLFGMIACVLVFPLALVAGPIRHIPFFWRMIDCSFGVIGIVPLYICYKKIVRLNEIIRRREVPYRT